MRKADIIKKIDQVAGSCLALSLSSPCKTIPPKKNLSILFIRPGGIGDAVHLIPAINLVAEQYTSSVIDVLAETRNVTVFSMCPIVRHVYRYDVLNEYISVMRSSYEVIIDTEQWYRLSAVTARLIKSKIKIGFATNIRRRMFTHIIPYSHNDYEAISFSQLLEPLGIYTDRSEVDAPYLSAPVDASNTAAGLLVCLNKAFITIFPGASIAERRWGRDKFRKVAKSLVAADYSVVVVGGKEDQLSGDYICAEGVGLNLAGKTTLPETAAIIQKSTLLISGDSGVLHIAVGLNIPSVSLFGPGRAKKWAPRGERHIVINKELPCSPCTMFGNTPPCPINAKCMSDISVEDVVNAATTLLKRVGAVSNAEQAQK